MEMFDITAIGLRNHS